ncbi:hypothetical protein Cgig2_031136 [Carnegiea gigantea]|uniref:Uncharacterized protein n=1 Tax=Carnegiea gigantea TaxID=171969 RepID=A0A9Q1QLX7_9CARY|nr:hypothetical protein Cgig2_000811 [Carnegiea gigantea]KAJ8447523.1 hypothetical protein Cgig2_031136 [Carnegiea gigantea]
MSSSFLGSPPLALVAFFGVVLFYLYMSTYFPFEEELENAIFTFKIVLFFLPAFLLFLMRCGYKPGEKWFLIRIPKPDHDAIHRAGGSPWGMAVLVALLLVMISYHSSVGSRWFRPLWTLARIGRECSPLERGRAGTRAGEQNRNWMGDISLRSQLILLSCLE